MNSENFLDRGSELVLDPPIDFYSISRYDRYYGAQVDYLAGVEGQNIKVEKIIFETEKDKNMFITLREKSNGGIKYGQGIIPKGKSIT